MATNGCIFTVVSAVVGVTTGVIQNNRISELEKEKEDEILKREKDLYCGGACYPDGSVQRDNGRYDNSSVLPVA